MKQVFKYLWEAIDGYGHYYLLLALVPICGAFYKPVVYYAMKLILDTLTNPDFNYHQILLPFLLYVGAECLLSFAYRGAQLILLKSEPFVQRGILLNALQKIMSFKYDFFQNTTCGSIISKMRGLLDGYNDLRLQLYYGLPSLILVSATSGFSIFFVNVRLG